KAGNARRGDPRHRAAPAVTHDADLAGGLRRRDRGRDVLHRIVPVEALHHLAAGFDLGRAVARVVVALRAIEHRGRDHEVAVRGVAIRDRLDMAVHSEDFLDHDYGAAWLTRWFRPIRRKLVPVFG